MDQKKQKGDYLIDYKPTWQSGKTITIRVPRVFKERLLAIAREMDKQYQEEQQQPQ
ncbi:MAG: hypothetical protein HWQ38_18765 [Nostoc sp. NMS7]|uniref:hypothetical protein n=1 Tax=Nostoc sp. NMS7 TaxID=2815391 RepID=UPI0025CEFB30|nr:hypothetical protein [Nostoc sp. NMS7]MBN3948378.1 hypothetical protein [Nostoc sp. NMS7]